MTTENIINTIYKYYPKHIGFDNIKATTDSQEYRERVKKCHDAANNSANWADFKNELTIYTTAENGSRVYDYSMLGNVPCYHGSLGYDVSIPYVISVLISVIIPLWAYRIMDVNDLSPMRYKPISEEEERVIIKVDSLIKKYFPGYGFIDESQHQIVVSHIATAFKSGPTIFEAIFTENEN